MKFTISSNNNLSPILVEAQGFALIPHMQAVRATLAAGDYATPESSVNLPTDECLLADVDAVVHNVATDQLKYVFVIGIGGSNLGTKALYEALELARDMVGGTLQPRLLFLDTNNSVLITSYLDILRSCTSPAEYICVSISKSGETTETIANTELFLTVVRERWGNQPDRLIIITDMDSPYHTSGQMIGAHCLSLPPMIGGRYSVFSAVGLVPLALAGFDIRELRSGAESILPACVQLDVSRNLAATAALLQVQHYNEGKNIHDLFIFNSELESLGKWWRQLLAESVGKSVASTTTDTTDVIGITPTVSIGSTDLHSVGQLYLGGPSDKLTTFLYAPTPTTDLLIPSTRIFPNLVPMITGVTTGTIISAILDGTKAAYTEHDRPFVELALEKISLFELGAFMQFKMIETMYIGRLLGVNPFDQPNVESYKTKTKDILEQYA